MPATKASSSFLPLACMIQVSIPAAVLLKEFDYNAEMEPIIPVANTVANTTFQRADVDWFIKADDIVMKNKGGQAGTA